MTLRVAAALFALTACAGCESLNGTNGPPEPMPPSSQPTEVASAERGVIPVGQELDVRLQTQLSSGTAKPEQRFETTTVVDVMQDGSVLIPSGSVVRGVVRSVDEAGRIDRNGRLTLAFDELRIGNRTYQMRAMPTQAFESGGIKKEAGKIGAGGAVGAILGGILGGLEGAVIGAAVGAGGVIAATEGRDVVLPAGTIIRLRMDSPLRLR